METTTGIYGVIGGIGIPLLIIGIMILIVHIATKTGTMFNLRQGTYHDTMYHEQDQEQKHQE